MAKVKTLRVWDTKALVETESGGMLVLEFHEPLPPGFGVFEILEEPEEEDRREGDAYCIPIYPSNMVKMLDFGLAGYLDV